MSVVMFLARTVKNFIKKIDKRDCKHGTIIRTVEQEEHGRKFLVIWATQLAGRLLLKMLKSFEVMLNIFEFSHVKEIVES